MSNVCCIVASEQFCNAPENKVSALAWYAGRAAAMSPGEMAWRAGRVGHGLIRRFGSPREPTDATMLRTSAPDWATLLHAFREGEARPVLLDQPRASRIATDNPDEVQALLAEADRLVAGERAYFGYATVNIGNPIDWNYDPNTGYRWPAVDGNSIDHRVASSDPKWIWELNRLQHLPLLAQAWLYTGEPRYAEAAFDHLDSWLDQNPTDTGIAWRGAFEAGLRATSVAIALQGLRTSPELTVPRYRRIVRMLDASARRCWRDRSRFSSANNHLVGELTGLLTVHLLFPELAAPASVSRRAIAILTAEAERQILPDGAGAEQSVCYQMLTVELLSVVVTLLRLRGEKPPAEMVGAIERSSRYFSSLVGSDDPDPRYGDDDDGFALRLGAEPKRTVRQHLGIAAAVTGDPQAGRYARPTLTAAWTAEALCTHTGPPDDDTAHETPGSFYAPHGGLAVLRTGQHRLTMDVGPLGYLSIAAHGHADALAVTLSDAGHELIVDPGTASYYGKPAWRAVHRGTRVHPTVCVDGLDQSVIGGSFYWRRHASTTVRSVDLHTGIIDAQHDGYRRLSDPVLHRRWLINPPGDQTIAVVDLLDGSSTHEIDVSWPLHPELDLAPIGSGAALGHLVTREGVPVLQLCYAATAPIRTEQVRGDLDNDVGWCSDRLEARTASWLVGVRCNTTAPTAILTLLRAVDAGTITEPQIVMDGARLTVSWAEHGIAREIRIDRTRPGAVTTGLSAGAEKVVSTW